jgi:hypothetical protein
VEEPVKIQVVKETSDGEYIYQVIRYYYSDGSSTDVYHCVNIKDIPKYFTHTTILQ